MSQSDSYQQIARKFVDLWQEHMSAMMNDGEFIRALLQMMQSSPFTGNENPTYANPFTSPAPGSAAPAFDALAYAMARIERRLDAIEERLGTAEKPAPSAALKAKPGRVKAKRAVVRNAGRPRAGRSGRKGSAKKSR